ncbi:hypothetical protein QBC47DRAFT_180318 [Echria macrotheca]|uniref:GH64 domain-containing protein n=1 Tax=Echria macrotheca TaxID=438768 RepID=A0AAJ0BF42_9PEZI|nr:hypothetical protein QBC47DRAFT_180318 [Echria macrotheca]
MTTLEHVLAIQKRDNILQAPSPPSQLPPQKDISRKTTTPPTLQITLQNNTTSSTVFAYITGLDLQNSNAVFILSSDGLTPYHPPSPAQTLTPLSANCHIALGAPGTSRTVTIPQLAGGRIWFCVNSRLSFFVNPGPALVEPSVMNPSDPNYQLQWSFAEFTYNDLQLFANISYVDFVSLPISLALTSSDPTVPVQLVPGMEPSGLDAVCAQLRDQHNIDGADWDRLVVSGPGGGNLRALSPNAAINLFAPQGTNLFGGYYEPYVTSVWVKYTTDTLSVDTQAQWGTVQGTVTDGKLTFPGVGAFPPPSTQDIFSCSTGAFGFYPDNTAEMGNITARLAAAFNRSTLLFNANQPDGEVVDRFYTERITNHYSRIVHGVNALGRGYAFPYDDVAARDEDNVAGTVAGGAPGVFVVAVGGSAVVPGGWEAASTQGVDQRVVDGDGNGARAWLARLWNGGQKEKDGSGLVTPRTSSSPPPESIVPPGTEQAAAEKMEAMAEREAREAERAAQGGGGQTQDKEGEKREAEEGTAGDTRPETRGGDALVRLKMAWLAVVVTVLALWLPAYQAALWGFGLVVLLFRGKRGG